MQADAAQIATLDAYCAMVEKWNRVMNLVSRKDISRLRTRHVLDSLSVHSLLRGPRVLDVGSGAGLPGVPLAIVCPDMTFTLCDRISRRARFLDQVVRELALENVEIAACDVGELPDTGLFDTAVCRAVATADEVWAMVAPLLTPSATLVFFASTQSREDGESTAVAGTRMDTHEFNIPGLEQAHTVWQFGRAPA